MFSARFFWHIALRRLARTSGFFTTTWCATCLTVFSSCSQPPTLARDEDVNNYLRRRSDQNQLARKSHADLDGRHSRYPHRLERKRLPQAFASTDMIIDDDCPMCRMVGTRPACWEWAWVFGISMDQTWTMTLRSRFFKTRQGVGGREPPRDEFNKELDRGVKNAACDLRARTARRADPFFDPEHGISKHFASEPRLF